MGQMLSVKEVADVKGCSHQYIKRVIKDGKLRAVETLNDKNRKTYLVPLEALDREAQRRWYQKLKEEQAEEITQAAPEKRSPLDQYSDDERKEIGFWTELIGRWDDYRRRAGIGEKAEADQKFLLLCNLEYPDKEISLDILYRKRRAVREKNLSGLVDKRGKWRRGQSSVPELTWQAFLYYYLDESRHPIRKCMEYTGMWLQEKHPELLPLPTYSAVYRKVQRDLPVAVTILSREGKKAYDDRVGAYIQRSYEDMQSNEWWIADNHTFDVIVVDKAGKQHRPYLTAFLDARSMVFTGYYITYNPSSEATLLALRRGILKYGIPENIYVDNGREFLTHDVGGLGHRKKKPKDGVELYEPPGVFQRLGIRMTNALVRNAKAKIIERRFRDVKDGLSRLFDSYTGGNVVEKPERLKHVLKKGNLYTDEEFESIVETMIEGYFNMSEYHGKVTADRGKKKIDVYNEHLSVVRKAKPEDLHLMMLRSSRVQTVGRLGVHLDIKGTKLNYWNDEFKELLFGKQVYFRYDPDDLSSVRVYDLEDRFIMEVPVDNEAIQRYGSSEEEVKAAMAKTRSGRKKTQELKEQLILSEMDRVSAMEISLTNARRQLESYDGRPNADIIEIQRAEEEPLFKRVVGSADLDVMNLNAERKARRQG